LETQGHLRLSFHGFTSITKIIVNHYCMQLLPSVGVSGCMERYPVTCVSPVQQRLFFSPHYGKRHRSPPHFWRYHFESPMSLSIRSLTYLSWGHERPAPSMNSIGRNL
jgi:hypothetical protein